VSDRLVLACALIGAGAVAKVFPIVLLPLALIELWRRGGLRAVGRGVVAAAGVIAVCVVPFLAVAPHGLWWALQRQFSRPLQVESLGAAFFEAAHLLANVRLHVVKSAGSDNLVGSGPQLAATLSGIATIVALLAVYWLYARSGRTREQLVVSCAAAVTAYVAFSKVFSPQYLVWLIPLVPLVGGRRGLRAGALLLVIVGMTQIWEPYQYFHYYKTFTPWITWLVIARDLLVLVLVGLLVRPSDGDADELDRGRAALV
jgi:uncharacterized membrane protein